MASHRGRIQAQGGGVQKSVKWAQDTPLTVNQALALLDQLVEKLTPRERQQRQTAIERQRRRIVHIGRTCGGIDHFQTWCEPPELHVRIDIEVSYGRAFVPD